MNRPSRFLFAAAGILFGAAPLLHADAPEDAPTAVVAGTTFTVSDVDRIAADKLRRLKDDEYAIRRQALEDLADQALAVREAVARGVTVDDLLKAEVDAKTPDPTDAEVKEFYDQNKARMGDKSYEEVLPIMKNFMRQQDMGVRRAEFMRSLKARYGMTLSLEVPRADVSPSTAPFRGAKDAPVTMIEFSDYQCPFCGKSEETLKKIEAMYGKNLRVVFRDFPLAMHPNASRAAEAAACADAQGKFWPYHDVLFANQDKLSEEGLLALGVQAGLKKDALAGCLASGKFADKWRHDSDEGRKAGVTGTPTFFVNGRMLFGNVPYEGLVQAIDDELLRLGKPLPNTADAAPAKKGKKK